MTKNKTSTRYASQTQESRIAKKFDGRVNANSGAGNFSKSDVVIPQCSMSIECKTSMTDKKSVSIPREWIDKHKAEAFSNRLEHAVIAFNYFYEDEKDYYIIDDKLMHFLIDKITEEYS